MSDFMLDVGLANELKLSLRRAGWTEWMVKKALASESFFTDARQLLLGHAVLTDVPGHMIDLDPKPATPDGWVVARHQKYSLFRWDPSRIIFLQPSKLKRDQTIEEVLKDNVFRGKFLMNATLLEYLLLHPTMISDDKDWKDKEVILFPGTTFRVRNQDVHLDIRGLSWDVEKRPYWHWFSLDDLFLEDYFVATFTL